MSRVTLLAGALLLCACGAHRETLDFKQGFIDIQKIDDTIIVDIPYATHDNFTKTILYPVNRCLLRYPVAVRLALVQGRLRRRGLGLKVWDCYRPHSIQKALWALVPDPRYVADPKKGSRHNRGAAVDITLVDSSGREFEMPTGYDDFSEKAHRNYKGASEDAAQNRDFLADAMATEGFTGLKTEWWHFDAPGWREFPLADVPLNFKTP